ncbi:unnamed protein product [Paramecium octaurelia]|uniref:Uncharacterized protein n=1 Tax=Paramecium octaurelia TaxID=43137 RepID=A0A8S1XCY3_PAROT|nr:unnamed protein product [Paramecium octaurelia]
MLLRSDIAPNYIFKIQKQVAKIYHKTLCILLTLDPMKEEQIYLQNCLQSVQEYQVQKSETQKLHIKVHQSQAPSLSMHKCLGQLSINGYNK